MTIAIFFTHFLGAILGTFAGMVAMSLILGPISVQTRRKHEQEVITFLREQFQKEREQIQRENAAASPR